MGKSSNPQPSHPHTDAGAAVCQPQIPSKSPGVSSSRAQLSSFPASSPTKSLSPPKPTLLSTSSSLAISPLTATLSSSPVHVYHDAISDSTPPLSPTDEEEIFYDAEDNLPGFDFDFDTPPVSAKPVRTSGIQQAPPDPYEEGASKGRMGVAPNRSARVTVYPSSSPAPVHQFPPARGSTKPSASPSVLPLGTSLASWIPASFSPLSSSLSAQSRRVKRALLIGINYNNFPETKRLKHAAKDAERFGDILKKAVSFEEVQLITDGDKSRPPTRETILGHFDWLVSGVKEGDQLVALFSGHCAYIRGQPHLITTGNVHISKEDLVHRLLSRVPAKCRLDLVLDCCHSAALVDLQYCVGKMGDDLDSDTPAEGTTIVQAHAEAQRTLSNPTQAPAPVAPIVKPGSVPTPERSSPHLASLNGIPIPEDNPPPAPPPIASKLGMDSYEAPAAPAAPAPAPTAHRAPRRGAGVVAAPPLASAAPAEPSIGATVLATLMGTSGANANAAKNSAAPVTSGEMRKTRQLVVEGVREPDYFKERKEGFVKLPGDVTVWAAAGANQLAFEASGGVENGVVTNALCTALAACGGKIPTRREVWRYLTSSLETENTMRDSRDRAKTDPPDRSKRIQHAELWVSQAQPLSSAAPVLDDPAF